MENLFSIFIISLPLQKNYKEMTYLIFHTFFFFLLSNFYKEVEWEKEPKKNQNCFLNAMCMNYYNILTKKKLLSKFS